MKPRSFTNQVIISSLAVSLASCGDRASSPEAPRFAVCAARCGSDQGQLVVDPAANTLIIGGASQQILAQVITPDTTGHVVDLRMPVSCDATGLRIDVRNVNPDGTPTLPPIAPTFSRVIPNSLLSDPLDGTLHPLNIGRGFGVTAGTPIAIVLSASDPAGSCGIQQGPVGDSYAFGDAWFIAQPNPPDVWVALSSSSGRSDLPFETFVRF
jgi:hypothetical protein